MQPISATARWLLVLLAAFCAAFAAIDPIGTPEWVNATIAALATLCAGAGIVPPSWALNPGKTRALKRGTHHPAVDEHAQRTNLTSRSRGRQAGSLIVGPILATACVIVGLVLVFAVPAHGYLHVANAQNRCINQGTMAAVFTSWAQSQGSSGGFTYGANGPWSSRVNDNAVIVHCAFKNTGSYPWRQGEARVYMVGEDSTATPYFGGGWPQWVYLGNERCASWCFADPGF